MAAPVIVACTKDTWVKVATNVTACRIWRLKNSKYRMIYVLTGGAAPTVLTGAVPIFADYSQYYDFSTAAAADVYLYAADSAGSVRIDT